MDSVAMIQIVAKALQNLKEDVVFIGGATLPLYFTKEPSFEARPTDDVDCVIELATRGEYYQLLSERKTTFQPAFSLRRMDSYAVHSPAMRPLA